MSLSLGQVPTGAQNASTLEDRTEVVCRVGVLMLTAGTASYRVKLAMGRVAAALGVESLQAQVSLNEIVVTTAGDGRMLTRVVEVPPPAVDTDRISALGRLSQRISPGLTVPELHEQLDAIQKRPHLYSVPVLCAAAALACVAFAFLNHGGWVDCLVAGGGAAVGKWVQIKLRPRHVNPLVVVALAAAAACGTVALVAIAVRAGSGASPGPVSDVALISAVLFLVPGFPLLTSALDLARFDFTVGFSRLLFAVLLMGAATIGVWPLVWAVTLAPADSVRPDLAWGALLALRCVAGFAGVFGFAVTFNTPMRVILVTSVIGMAANTLRLSLVDLGVDRLLCAMGSTFLVGLLAAAVHRRLGTARIALSVPAVVIMIPGVVTYDAILAMATDQPVDAISYGLTSLSTVGALAIGLVLSRMLTDPAWTTPAPAWTRPPHAPAVHRVTGGRG